MLHPGKGLSGRSGCPTSYFMSPDLDGKRFVANTECDRNEFLLLPIPIETDWLKLFPIPGFGRRALNFQIEILGNQVDLGQPLGLR